VIYADNAATTKISDHALRKMLPFLQEQYGNASSQYSLGMNARRAVEFSRQQAAKAIGAEPSEITFTSGGSEADSWVIRGVVESNHFEPIHIITSAIEHHAVLNSCRALEKDGIEVTYLPVSGEGCVSIRDVAAAIQPNTKLVSIMFANNEVGTIQPIAEIGRYLRGKDIQFHTDAVQAVGHVPIDVKEFWIDYLSASAHKFNGPKGIGFLYQRPAMKLPPLIYGGEQEYGQRAGTENVAEIVGLGYALEESVAKMASTKDNLSTIAKVTADGLKAAIPDIRINGEDSNRLPGIINVTFPHVSGESMMHLLDLKGICVSTSSACTAGNDEPSHVLLALGLSEHQAKSSIRISFGRYNTEEEAQTIVSAISNAYSKIIAGSTYFRAGKLARSSLYLTTRHS
jgi:cysteine desulfurase